MGLILDDCSVRLALETGGRHSTLPERTLSTALGSSARASLEMEIAAEVFRGDEDVLVSAMMGLDRASGLVETGCERLSL